MKYHDGRGLDIGEARSLNGRKVDSALKVNWTGVFSDSEMPKPTMGMGQAFLAWCGRFPCTGSIS